MLIDRTSLFDLGMGASVLSAGGGSFPYLEYLGALELLEAGASVPLIAAADLAASARVGLVAMVGAPLPLFERFVDPDHFTRPVDVLAKYLGVSFDAIMGYEIGSMNGIIPVMVAAKTGLPLVDADTLGRSFPEVQMSSFAIAGVDMAPFVLSDVRANDVIVARSLNGRSTEEIVRATSTAFGCIAAMAGTCSGDTVHRHAISGTYSRAIRLGAAIRTAQQTHADPIAALMAAEHGVLLARGRISDVARQVTAGFVRGRATIAPLDSGADVAVHFQNEYTAVMVNERPVSTVPDLICIFDSVRGEPVGTEALRYAQQVAVVGFPPMAAHCTPAALKVVGPRCFGYDFDHVTPHTRTYK